MHTSDLSLLTNDRMRQNAVIVGPHQGSGH